MFFSTNWGVAPGVFLGLETSHVTLDLGQIRTGVCTPCPQGLGLRIPQKFVSSAHQAIGLGFAPRSLSEFRFKGEAFRGLRASHSEPNAGTRSRHRPAESLHGRSVHFQLFCSCLLLLLLLLLLLWVWLWLRLWSCCLLLFSLWLLTCCHYLSCCAAMLHVLLCY